MTEVYCYVEGCIERDPKTNKCTAKIICIKNRDRTGEYMKPYCTNVSN